MTSAQQKAWLWFGASLALMALVLLLAAGTVRYWHAWACLGVTAAANLPLTRYIAGNPRLLESRMRAGPSAERRPIQKLIVLCVMLPALAVLIVPGLDRRFGWSHVPAWLAVVGDALILLGMALAYRVFRENAFGSATIEIGAGQRVVSTGPYAIVRHPMYASAALYFIGMALGLGSWWGLVPALLAVLGLVWRLFDEETFLAENLPGYPDYCARVRRHLIPGIF
ncbi:MAG TPA: isoprenylcysteine carboxylmethyltransferase family protein [Candidatus Sulfotelmatobacter sp.]|nr:isoprenylcysteine carboxylmethyltransferase family protein [Candidatus Sulfotelmatobacter sp.]